MNFVLGAIFIFAGKKIFWLFVASLGFLYGVLLSANIFWGQTEWQTLVIALAFGLLGLVLALFLQKLAVAFSGFIAGGYIFLSLCNMFGWHIGQWQWVLLIAGGIIGSGLFILLFNPALIVFSSFIGAMLIVKNLPVTALIQNIMFTALFMASLSYSVNEKIKSTRKPDFLSSRGNTMVRLTKLSILSARDEKLSFSDSLIISANLS